MSPTSYLAAPPRDIVALNDEFCLVTQNSSFIILKRKGFVNCFFAVFTKKIKKYEKVFLFDFFVFYKAEKILYNARVLRYNRKVKMSHYV